jgi:thioesterase domain-containing protein
MMLAGHCYGGIVAFDVAQRLKVEGEDKVALVLVDAPAPGLAKIRLGRYLRYLPTAAKEVLRGRGRTLIKEAIGHTAFLKRRHNQIRMRKSDQSDFASDLPPAGRIVRTYVPPPFHGKATHILARDSIVSSRILKDPRLGWRDLMGDGLEEHWIGGDHNSIFEEPNVATLAERLRAVLQELER